MIIIIFDLYTLYLFFLIYIIFNHMIQTMSFLPDCGIKRDHAEFHKAEDWDFYSPKCNPLIAIAGSYRILVKI